MDRLRLGAFTGSLCGLDPALELDQDLVHLGLAELGLGTGQGVGDPLDHGLGVHVDALALEVTTDLVAEAVVDADGLVVEVERVLLRPGDTREQHEEHCERGEFPIHE